MTIRMYHFNDNPCSGPAAVAVWVRSDMKLPLRRLVCSGTLAVALILGGCASGPFNLAAGGARHALVRPARSIETGLASYYHDGTKTADALTAAHRTLPFGTWVRVTNLANSRTVTVRITDRGPFIPDRVIDLSYEAAAAIGMTESGLARVRLDVLP